MMREKGLWIHLRYSFAEHVFIGRLSVPRMGKIMENMALALMEFRLGKILNKLKINMKSKCNARSPPRCKERGEKLKTPSRH